MMLVPYVFHTKTTPFLLDRLAITQLVLVFANHKRPISRAASLLVCLVALVCDEFLSSAFSRNIEGTHERVGRTDPRWTRLPRIQTGNTPPEGVHTSDIGGCTDFG